MGTNTYPVTIRNAFIQAKLIVNNGENQEELISDTHKTILTARRSIAQKVPRVALSPRRRKYWTFQEWFIGLPNLNFKHK